MLGTGAHVNWKDSLCQLSGPHCAALKSDRELMDLLLAQTGVDVNIKRGDGSTPLMDACVRGHSNIVRKLLQVVGVDVNCTDIQNWTALHLAVYCNSPSCVELLMGAEDLDWNVRSVEGHYPVTLAVERGYADILRIILSVPGDRVDLSVEVDGDNLALLAVKNSDNSVQLRCMKLLCKDERVDWNTRDEAGNTPLLFCLKGNQLEMARLV